MKGESPEEFLARAGIREALPPDDHEGNAGKGKKAILPAEPKVRSQTNFAAEDREAIRVLSEGDIELFVERAKADPGFPFEPEAIGALKRMAPADFERLRSRLKADRQVRLPALEAAMRAAAGGNPASDGRPGKPITFHEIESWSEPVDGAALLTEIAETIGKYVIMDPHQRDAAALGAVFAHTHDLRDTAPIFFIVSPTKRCGKTRLERVIKRLTPKPLMASSATPAFLARAIEKHRPTILIDGGVWRQITIVARRRDGVSRLSTRQA